jgi:hypothetical protein
MLKAAKHEVLLLLSRISTTSFLTAATLIYATGAGITAAAGPYYHPSLGISS